MWKLVPAVAMAVLFLACASEADAQRLTADYQFRNTRSSAVAGAPPLTDLGNNSFAVDTVDGVTRPVLRFAMNDGLALTPTTNVTSGERYTIVMLFKLSQVGGFRRLIDFQNGRSDTGAYILDGHLKHGDRTDTIRPNAYVQVVYSRDGSKESQRGYVDGRLVYRGTAPDAFDQAIVGDTLRFFRDDVEFPNEASAGAVARIRIFDGALTDAEVAALDHLPPSDGNGITACSSTVVAIPDKATATSTIRVDESLLVKDVKVRLFITHPNVSDLRAVLRSPKGTEVVLFDSPSRGGANLGTTCTPQPDCVFVDAPASVDRTSAPFVGENGPNTWLGYLRDQNAKGDWTLVVTDSSAGATGTINCWCLEIDGMRYGNGLVIEHVSGDETFSPIVVQAVMSLDDQPVVGAGVTFDVDGPGGPVSSGTILTDADGRAVFTYTRFRSGTETVTAGSGGKRARIHLGGQLVFTLADLFFACGAPRSADARGLYDGLPLTFELNRGQVDSRVAFLSRGASHSLFLTPVEAVLSLGGATRSPATLRLKLARGNPAARLVGEGERPERVNSFAGRDPRRWRTNVPAYDRVRYRDVYPGIDLVYYGNQRRLEYDFVVAPGADPNAVALDFEGATAMTIDARGDLVLGTGETSVRQQRPVVYQERDGVRQYVSGAYAMRGDRTVGFRVGSYDPTRPLVIDPILDFATYLGGSGDDRALGAAVDATGAVYVTGYTASANFPTTGAVDPSFGGGGTDAFVVKLSPDGSRAIYTTYVGGDGQDAGTGIAVDAGGNAYVAGYTSSTDFPLASAIQGAQRGMADAFLLKLGPTGSTLAYSTYLGGDELDLGSDVAVDVAGNAYVTGVTESADFPTARAIQGVYGGEKDAFLTKVSADGSELEYSTYLGGSGMDGALSVAVGPTGDAYVTGATSSRDFPVESALQTRHGGGAFDAFAVRVAPTGGTLVYSTYLGGAGEDGGYRLTLDAAGNACVAGETGSTDFPTVSPAQAALGGLVDAFVAKIAPTGSRLVTSTYLGGEDVDRATGIAVDGDGNVYVTGFTRSADFPVAGAMQPVARGNKDGFVAKLAPSGAALLNSTFFGGFLDDEPFDLAVTASGDLYLIGHTTSPDLPTRNALQPSFRGTRDLFVAKLVRSGPTVTNARFVRKKLIVSGEGFDDGAEILIAGQPIRTLPDRTAPTTALVGKRATRVIAPGETVRLRVRTRDGALSNEILVTRAT